MAEVHEHTSSLLFHSLIPGQCVVAPFPKGWDASCRYQTSEDQAQAERRRQQPVDVSDLGITMDQLYEPLNDDMDIESRIY